MRIIKAFRFICVTVLLMIGTSVNAFTVDGICYAVESLNDLTCKVLSVDKEYTGDIVIPDRVIYKNRTFEVISVFPLAFKGCSKLTSIVIPNSMEFDYIWEEAFNGCSSLTSFVIPNSVTEIGNCAFTGCSSLTSITIPNSVTKIGDFAFSRCSSLTSITIPNSVTEIGNRAFGGCSKLKELTIEDGKEPLEIEHVASYGKDTGTFYDCDCPLTTLYLGRNISYPDGEYICSPFYNIPTLEKVTIGNSVTEIEKKMFKRCSGLKELTILDGTEPLKMEYSDSYGYGTFYDCPLTTLYLGRNISYYPPLREWENYSIFWAIHTLTKVTISNSVTEIGQKMFGCCDGLTSVDIPNSVIKIGELAFYYCSSLTNITIPNSVIEIGDYAFNCCSSLTELYSFNPMPPSVHGYCFTNEQYMDMNVYVPQGSLSAYQNADKWKNFWNMQEFDPTGIEAIKADRKNVDDTYYDIQGRKLNAPQKGINIINGKKVLIKE